MPATLGERTQVGYSFRNPATYALWCNGLKVSPPPFFATWSIQPQRKTSTAVLNVSPAMLISMHTKVRNTKLVWIVDMKK